MLLPLDDKRWTRLEGGYRTLYDPRSALGKLHAGDETAWEELCSELHHQDDVGVASYAAVPYLFIIHRDCDVPAWQTYALMTTIELCRRYDDNPKLPKWLKSSYQTAWKDMQVLGCQDLLRVIDETSVRSIFSALALAKKLTDFSDILINYGPNDLMNMLKENGYW